MGRGTGNFALWLAVFASRLGLSRCEDGNNGTEEKNKKKKKGKKMRDVWGQVGIGGWGTRQEEQTKMAEMLCDFTKHTFEVGLRAKEIDWGRTPCHI